MKKSLLFLVTLTLMAETLPMPPALPPMPMIKEPKATKPKKADACSIIPPMLVNLPPMLEDDLDKCKNQRYLPSKEVAQRGLKKLLKRDVNVTSIKSVEGFSMLYEIRSDKGIFYCNRKVDRCLASSINLIK